MKNSAPVHREPQGILVMYRLPVVLCDSKELVKSTAVLTEVEQTRGNAIADFENGWNLIVLTTRESGRRR